MTVYKTWLGENLATLPPENQALHVGYAPAEGEITVRHHKNPFLGMLARLSGFPPPMENVRLRLETKPASKGDIWVRHMGDIAMQSRLWCEGAVLMERLGPVTLGVLPDISEGRLSLIPAQARVLGVRVPLWLLPKVDACEFSEEGRYCFDVKIRMLGTTVVTYRGWLKVL